MMFFTNEEVRNTMGHVVGSYGDLITTVIKHKLRWYGHIKRSTDLQR